MRNQPAQNAVSPRQRFLVRWYPWQTHVTTELLRMNLMLEQGKYDDFREAFQAFGSQTVAMMGRLDEAVAQLKEEEACQE